MQRMKWKRIFARPPNWWQLFESFARMFCAILWLTLEPFSEYQISYQMEEGETWSREHWKANLCFLDILWAKFNWIHGHYCTKPLIHETQKSTREKKKKRQNDANWKRVVLNLINQ